MQLYASAGGKQLYASADVLIGEYGPHEPTHTENRLAGESLSTPARKIEDVEKQEEQERGRKVEMNPCGEVRSQEECEGIISSGLLAEGYGPSGGYGPAGQSSLRRPDCALTARSSERPRITVSVLSDLAVLYESSTCLTFGLIAFCDNKPTITN
jgi:hypothetical protein